MYKFVTIELDKKRAADALSFSLGERVLFCLGAPVKYRDATIEGSLGSRTIFIDLKKGGEIPTIPTDAIEHVKYEHGYFKTKYPNGEGYYGDVLVQARTMDGLQNLLIKGPSTEDVQAALAAFEKGELPPNWEEQLPRVRQFDYGQRPIRVSVMEPFDYTNEMLMW
ncbi:MAG: hypothetical protein AAB964_01685 [Patescibacteria group bacterium]